MIRRAHEQEARTAVRHTLGTFEAAAAVMSGKTESLKQHLKLLQ